MNVKKLKQMISKENEDINMRCDERAVQQVNQFKYLGPMLTEAKGRAEIHVNARLGQGGSMFNEIFKILKRSLIANSKPTVLRTLA